MPSKEVAVMGASVVDMNLVEEAVNFINERLNQGAYKIYQEIGSYLLEKFFDGNIELASSKDPQKSKSYRELCRHEGLTIHPARLSIMVRVAAQEKFFLSRKQSTEHLCYTQKTELVKLPDDDEKIKLVKKFQKEGTSTKRAAELIAQRRTIVKRSKSSDMPDDGSPPIEGLPFDAKDVVGLLLMHPVRGVGVKPEELLALIRNPKEIAGVWKQFDNDKRGKTLEWIEIQLNDSKLLVQAFTVLRSEMRRLQGLE